MMQQMAVWARHDNEHVRRLASEGCRPALPWGQALTSFKKDPSPVLPILEQLNTDPSLYVLSLIHISYRMAGVCFCCPDYHKGQWMRHSSRRFAPYFQTVLSKPVFQGYTRNRSWSAVSKSDCGKMCIRDRV